jgi:hypothetical protein
VVLGDLAHFVLTVKSDKSRMSEFSSGAYVGGGKTLGAALNVIPTRSGGNCTPGTGSTVAVGTSDQTLISGNGGLLCSETWAITLSQTTAITDQSLASGHTYHIVLTYTLSGLL